MNAFLQSVSDSWMAWCVFTLVSTSVLLIAVSMIVFLISAVGLRKWSPGLLSILFFMVLLKPFVPVTVTVPDVIASRFPTVVLSNAVNLKSPNLPTQASELPASLVSPSSFGMQQKVTASIESNTIAVDVTKRVEPVAPIELAATVPQMAPKSVARNLSWSVTLLLGYGIGLVFLFLHFGWSQIRFHWAVKRADELPTGTWPFCVSELCGIAGLRRVPRVIEMPVRSPAVWGIIRPTLILPVDFANQLSPRSLRWALMHELAHLRRYDLLLHAIQRVLLMLQFWNPVAWIASYFVSHYRERACDDMALAWTDGDAVSAGEAFMHVVKMATDQHTLARAPTSLGVISSGGKRACKQRLKRLLDTDRPIRDRVGPVAFLFLLVVAVCVLPQHRVAQSAPPVETDAAPDSPSQAIGNSNPESNDQFVSAKVDGVIELSIIGPNNEPVPNASIELRPRIKTPWKFITGTHKRDASYGVFAETDSKGQLKVGLPSQSMHHFTFSIKSPGYRPFWASWETRDGFDLLPAKYVAKLDAGRSYGGVVVDENGNPIVGARVHPSIQYKKRERDESQLGMGWSATTDKEGKWRCDYVPASQEYVHVEFTHEEFAPTRVQLKRERYGIELDEEPSRIIKIAHGITLKGRVTDAEGQPIKDGATIRSVFINETRQVVTDNDGFYEMPGCPTGTWPVTVTAKGHAPDQVPVDFNAALKPVDFKLKPGGTVRIKVVDREGKPMKKARVFFQKWRRDEYGKGLGKRLEYTDEKGVWVWNEAPEDEFVATIYPDHSVEIPDQVFKPRDEEYLFTATPELVIDGTVISAVSGEPVPSFQVIPGMIWENRTKPHWMRQEGQDGRSGAFKKRFHRADGTHMIRVEADGYHPVASREIKVTEGTVKLTFKLVPAEPIAIKIMRPDGSPAAGSEAVIGIEGSNLQVRNGAFRSGSRGEIRKADEQGVLLFQPQPVPIRLIVLDQDGFTDQVVEPGKAPDSVSLTAWARVSGTLWHGKHVAEGVLLTASPRQSASAADLPDVRWQDQFTTDVDGHFRFPRVRPGEVDLMQNIITHQTGTTSSHAYSHRVVLKLEPGESRSLKYGGDGYQIHGKAISDLGDDDKVDWKFSKLSVKLDLGPPPTIPYPEGLTDEQQGQWYQEWLKTDEGQQTRNRMAEHFNTFLLTYGAKVAEDGSFEVSDLPRGKYTLSINLDGPPADGRLNTQFLGAGEIAFEISEDTDRGDSINVGNVVVTKQAKKPMLSDD